MHPASQREPEINKFFRAAVKHRASDLYLHVGLAPMVQLRGITREFEMRHLSGEDLERLLFPILSSEQKQTLAESNTVNFTYSVGSDDIVFQINVSREHGDLRLSASKLS